MLNCLQCGSEIATGHRFCGQCGSRAPIACGQCSFANAAGQRFCGGCGARLETSQAAVPAAAPPSAQPAAVAPPAAPTAPAASGPLGPASAATPHVGRRQVAILFTDLTGFTELSGRLDAEDLHAIAQSYFDRVERIVTAIGGTVERYVGDAVMAMFGARVAHGDDALRAVRAGMDIQAAMPELGARWGQALRCRVGIAAGEVVVMEARSGYAAEVTIVGQSVNLASRIQSLAAPGEVLISAAVHHDVVRQVQAAPLGLQNFKGIDAPVKVWRVEALADTSEAARTRFVGREAERGRLREALERVQRERHPAAVALVGEAGIGKTRLLGELAAMAGERGWATQRGRFVDFGFRRGAEGLHALACGLLGLDPLVADGASRQHAAALAVERGEVAAELLPMLYQLISAEQTEASRRQFDAMDPAQRERGLRAAVATLVATATARAPLLLILEDLHWAEPRDLDRLADLMVQARAQPLMLALSSRPVDDDTDAPWRAAGLTQGPERVELVALAGDALGQIAAEWGHLSPAVIEACIERSGGNPLFLEQLLRHAAESGAATIPASIKSLVLARMDLLGARDCDALQAASVLGQRFELGALRALIDDAAYDPAPLVQAHLLAGSARELHFAHALLHEAAYASLLKRSARDLHLRAASWYAPRDASLRARHLDRAGSAEAPRAYLDCAVADTEAGRYERARDEVLRGLEIATEANDRVALTLQHGRLLHDIGQTRESIEAYRRALDAASDDLQRGRAQIGLAAGMRLSDDVDGALAALAQAEPLVQGHDAELARLHYLRGGLCFPRGDIEGCQREHGLALEAARRAGLPRAEADALSGLGDAAYASGRMRSAHEAFAQCMALCARHGFGRIEAANRFMVATVRIYMCEFDGALTDALESAELARRVGHQRAEIVSRLTAGWILITLGRLDEAAREAASGLEVAQTLGAARFRPFLMESVARIQSARGQRDDALRTAHEALALAREGKLMRFIGPWLLATLALVTPAAAERQAALDEGAALLADGCVGHNYFNFYAEAIDASTDARDASGVLRWADALEAYTRAEPNPWAEFHIARARALAARLTGDEGACDALRRVRADAGRLGFRSAMDGLDAALAAQLVKGEGP